MSFFLFIMSMVHFLCQIPSLYPDCISLLLVLRFPILFLFLANSLMWSICIRWSFFLQFKMFASAWAFPKYLMSGIIAITNSNVDSASPSNIPLWIFISAKLFPLLSIPLSNFSWLPRWTFWLCQISFWDTFWNNLFSRFSGPYHMAFCNQSTP